MHCVCFHFSSKYEYLDIRTNTTGATITTTRRGTEVLLIGGYKFTKHLVIGGKVRWYCGTHRKRSGCAACVYTGEGRIVKLRAEHNHPPPDESLLLL